MKNGQEISLTELIGNNSLIEVYTQGGDRESIELGKVFTNGLKNFDLPYKHRVANLDSGKDSHIIDLKEAASTSVAKINERILQDFDSLMKSPESEGYQDLLKGNIMKKDTLTSLAVNSSALKSRSIPNPNSEMYTQTSKNMIEAVKTIKGIESLENEEAKAAINEIKGEQASLVRYLDSQEDKLSKDILSGESKESSVTSYFENVSNRVAEFKEYVVEKAGQAYESDIDFGYGPSQ